MHFLVTGLSLGVTGDNTCFCNMINYELEVLAMFVIYEYTIKETYVLFENMEKKNLFINDINDDQ